MTRLDRGTLCWDALVRYFHEGAKPRSQWKIGIEVEKMGVDRTTGRPIPYLGGPASVRNVLEAYERLRGGDRVYEADGLIGLEGSWGSLGLEPGGQVEWSSPPCPDLATLEAGLREHLEVLDTVGEKLGIRWLEVAVHPDSPVEDMPWMPKARYTIMRRYLATRGRLAHRMMTQTASIQCSFDYEDSRDWARKFRAAALLAPVAVALFANSSRADGRETGYRCFRQRIWRETDPDRCGLPGIVFEPGFGVESWTRWACRVPTIFRRGHAGLVASNGVLFETLMACRDGEGVDLEDWELHLSTLFTEVRSYTYIEARSADLQPDELILAVPAFWAGILYDDRSLDLALEIGSGFRSHEGWLDAMERASRFGLDRDPRRRDFRELAARAVGIAVRSLRKNPSLAGFSPARDPAAPLLLLAERRGFDPLEPAP